MLREDDRRKRGSEKSFGGGVLELAFGRLPNQDRSVPASAALSRLPG